MSKYRCVLSLKSKNPLMNLGLSGISSYRILDFAYKAILPESQIKAHLHQHSIILSFVGTFTVLHQRSAYILFCYFNFSLLYSDSLSLSLLLPIFVGSLELVSFL